MTGCSTLKSTGSQGWGIHGDATGHPTKTLHPQKLTWALKMMLSKFGISSSKGLIGAPQFWVPAGGSGGTSPTQFQLVDPLSDDTCLTGQGIIFVSVNRLG